MPHWTSPIPPDEFTGKPMRTMIYGEPAGIATEDSLRGWIKRAQALTGTLPPKRAR